MDFASRRCTDSHLNACSSLNGQSPRGCFFRLIFEVFSPLCSVSFVQGVFLGQCVSEQVCCSVSASQGRDVGQGEVWLLLTDAGLQEERRPEGPCRRTVALCVSTSCALTSSVLESLNSPAPCRMSFRDAVREHGRASVRTHVTSQPTAMSRARVTQTVVNVLTDLQRCQRCSKRTSEYSL